MSELCFLGLVTLAVLGRLYCFALVLRGRILVPGVVIFDYQKLALDF